MEINEIINNLKEIPTWGWFILAVIIVILFGDRKRWEYEVNISFIDNFGHGEIEIEASGNKLFKRERKRLEIELTLEPAAQNKQFDVFLNQNLIYTLSKHETRNKHVRINQSTT